MTPPLIQLVPEQNLTTDDPSNLEVGVHTETGEEKETILGSLRKISASHIRLFVSLSSARASTLTAEYTVKPIEPFMQTLRPIGHELALKTEQYVKIIHSFPGVVVDIERNSSGEPMYAIISVSVDGNDYLIKRSIRQIGFEVKPEMQVIVDCVESGGQKKLSFRLATPVELDEKEIELIKSL